MMSSVGRVVGAIALCAALASSLRPAEPEFTVRDYCEMTLKTMEMTAIEWKNRISLAQSHQGASKALAARLQTLDSQNERPRSRIYAQYGTTFQAYLRYGASHQNAISQYLEQYPETRGAIDDASARLRSLRQEMESVMSAKRDGGAQK